MPLRGECQAGIGSAGASGSEGAQKLSCPEARSRASNMGKEALRDPPDTWYGDE